MKVKRIIENLQKCDPETDFTVHDWSALVTDKELCRAPSMLEIMKAWAVSNGFCVNENDGVQYFLDGLAAQVKELR